MPTSAIDIDDKLTTIINPSQRQKWAGIINEWRDVASPRSIVLERRLRKRPASISKPVVSGWRGMTPWFHAWGFGRSNLADTVLTRPLGWKPSPSTSSVEQLVWLDGSFWGQNALNRPAALPPPGWLKSKCEIAALEKLRNSEVDLGLFMSELGETARTIITTMERIACEVSKFRRGNPKGLWSKIKKCEGTPRWKEVPSQWLGVQYGWNPLLSDVFHASAQLDALERKTRPVVHVKAGGRASDRRSVFVNGQNGSQIEILQTWEFHATVNLWYQLTNLLLARLSSLGLINPLLIAWERVPYSFVVDWLVPIGNWISSTTSAAGYSFLDGCYSVKSTCTESIVRKSINTGSLGPGCSWADNCEFLWSEGNFTRTLYQSSPVPGIYVKNPFSPTHLANAISLLVSAFR